jgi:hypothetical protein
MLGSRFVAVGLAGVFVACLGLPVPAVATRRLMDNDLPALSALPVHNFTLAATRSGAAPLRISATTVGFVPEPGMLALFGKAIAPELRACTPQTVAAVDAQALAQRVQASLHGWREGIVIAASHPFAIERPPWLLRSDDRLLVLYGVEDDRLVPIGNLDDRPDQPGAQGARPWSARLQAGAVAGLERRLVSGALPAQPTPCFTAFFITMAMAGQADDGAGPLRPASTGMLGGGGSGTGGGGVGLGGLFDGLPRDDQGDSVGPAGNPVGIGGGGGSSGGGFGGAGGTSGGGFGGGPDAGWGGGPGGGTGGGGFGGGPDAGWGGSPGGGPGGFGETGGGSGAEPSPPVDPITSAVPEPAGWMLLLIGFIATGAASRRRRPAVVAA